MSGILIVLNGAPRSGKTSIAREIQATFPGVWLNLGVDAWCSGVQPASIMPGIGLRPGEERLEIEAHLPGLFLALYQSAAAHCRLGFNVVMDLGHHDSYSESLGILGACAAVAAEVTSYLVGVSCPIETVLERRRASSEEGRSYAASAPGEAPPQPVLLWQKEVHGHEAYDLILDTSALSPKECAERIRRLLEEDQQPHAFPSMAEKFWDGD